MTQSQDIETIDLRGKDYAPVSERIKKLHSTYDDVSIETGYEFQEGWAICKAKVTISNTKKNGAYTGHSMDKITGEEDKAFEKLETVAVGRALANAGFLASGEIASAEEMEKFYGEDSDELKDDINNGDIEM